MILGYRSNDAVITICQNNRVKSIEIHDINKQGEELLGFSAAEVSHQPLTRFLPPRIAELLKEYVEYENDANDVGMVLSKVQSFSLVSRDGKETGYRMKVVRDESSGDTIFFKLVLQDKAGLRKNEALRKLIQDNFKGHEVLDAGTGLPDRYSLNKDLELMGYYNNKGDVRSCFAILQLDHYDEIFAQYGLDTCTSIIKQVALISRQNLRPDDVVGSVAPKRIGVVLIDTTPESARLVFNRLRWQIAANPYHLPDRSTIGLSISISFARVGGRISDKKLIEHCDEALNAMGAGAVNALTEVDEADKAMSG